MLSWIDDIEALTESLKDIDFLFEPDIDFLFEPGFSLSSGVDHIFSI